MIVFAGRDIDHEVLNDLWVFNFKNNQWHEITEASHPPIQRSGHTASIYNDKMIVFGGIHEVTKELNDMVLFDFKTSKWSVLFEELYQK